MDNSSVESLAAWGEPREVVTSRGRRNLRKAAPTESFWAAWRADKAALQAAGVSCGKDRETGAWEACWWQPIAEEKLAAEKTAIAASRATDADITVPAPAGLAYLPFQRAAVAYAATRSGVLLADEMGLGKTVEAIGIINSRPEIQRILIICPAGLKLNWQRELARWLVRPMTVGIASGREWPSDAQIIIINYDILDNHEAVIRANEWDLLIADEVHYLKNPRAQRTRAVFGHQDRKDEKETITPIPAKLRLFLTGTPIVNRPIELWPIVHGLQPTEFSSFWKFAIRYCGATRGRWGWEMGGASHLDELHERLRGLCMVRRRKADVLKELPPKRRQVVVLPANGGSGAVQRENLAFAAHEESLTRLRESVEKARAAGGDEYRAAVGALRERAQAAFAEIARMRHETALAKVPAVIEHVHNALDGGGKVVLFAHHHDVIARFAEAFPGAAIVTGEIAQADRQAAVDRFQNDESCRVFIGSITAAGVGITLTAAAHVVFAELDWVPGNITQAEDRTHRIGQTNSVLVQHLVLDGSLDARIAHTLVAKQAVLDTALDGIAASEPAI